jgi:UDP-N-acetylglucosamine:LPS N-acetylglucosamine transferase
MRFRDTEIGTAIDGNRGLGPTAVDTLRPPQWVPRDPGLRVLLLTSGLGTGHSRAAAAVARALRDQNPGTRIRTVDFWSLLDTSVADALQRTYLRLVTARPDLYQRLYQLDQHSWRNILENGQALPEALHELGALIMPLADAGNGIGERHWLDRLLFRQLSTLLARPDENDTAFRELRQQAVVHQSWQLLAKRLGRRIARFAPDAVIATQVNMAALAAHLKAQRRFQTPLIGIITDYGVHNFWLQRHVDIHCVADESMRGQFNGQAATSRVEVTGIPLMPEFSHPPATEAARQELGLAHRGPVVLILGGGLGLGIGSVVRRLANSLLARPSRPSLIVLAGRNRRLAGELQGDPAVRELMAGGRLRVQGWTEQVVTYMRAADLVIGKPGGLSTAEVLACGRPLFSTCSLRGQESFNVAYLQDNRVGELLSEEDLARTIPALLEDDDALRQMQSRAWALGRRHGAQCVTAQVLEFGRARV